LKQLTINSKTAAKPVRYQAETQPRKNAPEIKIDAVALYAGRRSGAGG